MLHSFTRIWPVVAGEMPRHPREGWTREAVVMDLWWWSAVLAQIRRRGPSGRAAAVAALAELPEWILLTPDEQGALKRGELPGRRALAARWGWSGERTRAILSETRQWRDPDVKPPTRGTVPGSPPQNGRTPKRRAPATRSTAAPERPLWLTLDAERVGHARAQSRKHPEWHAVLRAQQWTAEDLDQEILMRIHAREQEHGGYDPSRAGVGKYFHTLTQSILRNLLEGTRTAKATSVELGATTTRDGEVVTIDAAEVAVADWTPHAAREGDEANRLVDELLARGWVEFDGADAAGRFVEAVRALPKGGRARTAGLWGLLQGADVAEYYCDLEQVRGFVEEWG